MDVQIHDALGQLGAKLASWVDGFILMLPNLVVAVLVLTVAALLAPVAYAATSRVFSRLARTTAASALLARALQIAVLLSGLVVALSLLQLEKAVTSLVAGAGIVGLALGFAFQDLGANFISGIALSMRARYPFEVGDRIETNEVFGHAEEIHLRTTVIRTLDGQAVVIPNKSIFEQKLTNYSGDPAFDAEGITIPFPIRTLDFGIEGGAPLRAMSPERAAAAG